MSLQQIIEEKRKEQREAFKGKWNDHEFDSNYSNNIEPEKIWDWFSSECYQKVIPAVLEGVREEIGLLAPLDDSYSNALDNVLRIISESLQAIKKK